MSPLLSASLALFPSNGMDRSLHVAVLIGLVLSTFFTEAFGWTYAGLVVPGYIATVFAASPVTGAVVVVEGIVTYLLVALIGRWVTKTGAWSTAFGRERFYLFIVCAVVVRLAMDGWALPWLGARYQLDRAHELYSLGLVLVPLVANAFWNAGLVNALPRIGLVSLLTYALLLLLFHTTNLSVSRFQVINDSLSLKFLQEPKAHLILVLGAFLGARNNVRYGWDYNGILVPGLLAVAWYEPMKLATTAAEALTVYFLCVQITKRAPFSRMLIVGPRRMLMAYVVGFVVKLAGSHVLARVAPGVQLIDYFGFGYLLPALIAVKIWNKEDAGVVLMPTLQVSITAFVLGNGLGWALGRVLPAEAAISVAPAAVQERASVAMALMLGDSSQRLAVQVSRSDTRAGDTARDLAADILARGAPGDASLAAASAVGVQVTRAGGGARPFFVIAPYVDDPEATPPAPRAALRKSEGAERWIVLAEPRGAGSGLPVVAERIASAIGADAVVLLSPYAELRADDVLFARRIERLLAPVNVIVVSEGDVAAGSAPVLEVAERFGALDATALERALGRPLDLHWRGAAASEEGPWPAAPRPWPAAPRVIVAPDAVETVADVALDAPAVVRWSGALVPELRAHVRELTTTEPPFRPPSIEELRLFDAVLVPAMLAPVESPSAWVRAIAGQLGFRWVRIGPGAGPARAWALVEPGTSRRGWPTWVVRSGAARTEMLVEVPAPLWEMGTAGAALAIAEALEARGLLIHGALPDADPLGASDPRRWSGRRSFFQRVHEAWLGAGRTAVSIQAIAPDRGFTDDAVITYGFEALDRRQSPAWAAPLERFLGEDLQLDAVLYDGAGDRAPFGGSADPTMAYARRFAPGSSAIVYIAGPARAGFDLLTSERDDALARALVAGGEAVPSLDVAERAAALAACRAGDAACWPEPERPLSPRAACDPERSSARLVTFADLGYPADMEAARAQRGGCWLEVVRDEATGRVWALLARPGEARLVPLASPLARRPAVDVTDLAAARRVVRGGVARVTVRAAP